MKKMLIVFVSLLCSGCYYVPKHSVSRPPVVPMPASASGQACWNSVIQTHEICRGNCRFPYTQYNGREVEMRTQSCVTTCDDTRDANLGKCPEN